MHGAFWLSLLTFASAFLLSHCGNDDDLISVYDKKGGGRLLADFKKKGGGRPFFDSKRGGGRGFLGDGIKRAGGRSFYSPSDILNKRGGGRAFTSTFYNLKKSGGRPFYSFWKRAGGRGFEGSVGDLWKRAGGRGFPPENDGEMEIKRGGGKGFLPIKKKDGGGREFDNDLQKRGGGRGFTSLMKRPGFDNENDNFLIQKRPGARGFYGFAPFVRRDSPIFFNDQEANGIYRLKRPGGRFFMYSPHTWWK